MINENTKIYIADIEANGLIEKENGKNAATRIWCLSFCNVNNRIVKSITDVKIIQKFFEQDAYIIMHNGLGYDIRLVEKLLKFKIKATIIDSLGLSWTLFPERNLHGLESWGETFSIPKPPIIDWNDEKLLPEYINRCNEDVKINLALWERIEWVCNNLYDNQEDKWRYYEYISFKLQCVAIQQDIGVKINIQLIKEELIKFEDLKLQKIEALTLAMPKNPIKAKKEIPKVLYKANGELSSNGIRWFEFLKENNLPETHTEPVEYIKGYNEPNPNSHSQLKDWLFSLGWSPGWFKYVKEEGSREMRKIPQIASKDEPGEVCESIKKLIEKEPNIEELSGLGIISHRISVLKGFLRDEINGRLYQGISGITNTCRLQHTKIVNLPASNKPFSENIRASLTPDENMIMCGTDLSGVEDNTKRHYIYDYDPEYVEQMNVPGYDPHLELGLLAGFLDQEQVDFYKDYKKKKDEGFKHSEIDTSIYKNIDGIRYKSKTTNFSATYKVGKATLSRNSGLSLKESEKLLSIYWKRNKAILDVENSLEIKNIGSQMWLLNPVSKFWYSLRAEKDKFSTLNQGTAVFVFDKYIYYSMKEGIKPIFQVHDEFTTNVKIENKEETIIKLKKAIDNVNKELKLNVQIGASIDFGKNYSLCH